MVLFKYEKMNSRDLRHQEFCQHNASLQAQIKDLNLAENLDKILSGLLVSNQKTVTLYQNALKAEKDKAVSQEVQRLDKVRDHAIQAVLDSIKPFKNTINSLDKEAYDLLKALFDQFKGLKQTSSEIQTAQVNQLLGRLALTKYNQAVRLLGIGRFVTALQDVQNQYVAKAVAKNTQELTQAKNELATIRKTMEDAYRQLLTYVAIMAEITNKAEYIKIYQVVNQSRRYYIDLLNRRKKKRSKKEE